MTLESALRRLVEDEAINLGHIGRGGLLGWVREAEIKCLGYNILNLK